MEKYIASKLFFIILFVFAALFLWLCRTYVSASLLALLIASASYPLYTRIKGLFKFKEQTASLIMTVFIFLILVIPVGGFIGTLSKEALEFYGRTRDSVSMQKMQEFLQGDSLWAGRLRQAGEFTSIRLPT